jgi:hypothetical protein
MLATGRIDETASAALQARPGDLYVACNTYAQPQRFLMQNAKQRTAMDADAEIVRRQLRIVHVKDNAPARRLALDGIDPRSHPDRRSIKAELRQAGEPRRLQQDAGTERPRLTEALEKAHFMPGPR